MTSHTRQSVIERNFDIISNSLILQGNAAIQLRRGGYFYMVLVQNVILNAMVKEVQNRLRSDKVIHFLHHIV